MDRVANGHWAWIVAVVIGVGAMGCNKAELTPFESCDELEAYIHEMAIKEYTYDDSDDWRGSGGGWGAPGGMATPETDMAVGDDDDGGGGNSHSTTNTQEMGVDEADFVKTDGAYIYVMNGSDLTIVDVWPAEEMAEVSRLTIEGHAEELYLDGDRIAVLSQLNGAVAPEGNHAVDVSDYVTKVTVVDVTDRTAPEVQREVYVEGSLYSTRRVQDRLYLITHRDLADNAIQSRVWSEDLDDDEVEDEVEARSLSEWMPKRIVNTLKSGSWTLEEDTACDCGNVFRPNRDGGLEMMSVLALDFTEPEGEVTGTSVLAGAGEIYATPGSLYLAVYEPDYGPFKANSEGTRIHKFDLEGGPQHPVYEASGRVDGWTHNSFAMDYANGTFRIVTTSWNDAPWEDGNSSTGLYLLEQDGRRLEEIGSVEGIAPDETVYAVRFTDEVAYVVTFMQIDPLFTIDLRDPENPEVLGELEVTGYSTYLHPLGEEHLLAVGEAVDPSGVQISLFDIGDLTDPQLADREIVDTGWSGSEAIWDHHAFNYYEPFDLFAVPINNSYDWGEVDFAGLYVYDVTVEEGITYVGGMDASVFVDETVDEYYVQYCSQVRRSIVIEDVLYGVASGGIIAAPVTQPDLSLAVLAFPDNGDCDDWDWWDEGGVEWEEDW